MDPECWVDWNSSHSSQIASSKSIKRLSSGRQVVTCLCMHMPRSICCELLAVLPPSDASYSKVWELLLFLCRGAPFECPGPLQLILCSAERADKGEKQAQLQVFWFSCALCTLPHIGAASRQECSLSAAMIVWTRP